MAYGVKYRFHFESIDGADYTIDVLKNGYTGSVLSRALGGAPVLRRDSNECICGTSFDFIAECAVDREYEEFGQSDPFTFKVELYNYQSQDPIWQGFITPEIYRAPDIAPPYDVNVTATDGLGELKLRDFEAQGLVTLSYLLNYLLGFTGLSLGLATNLDFVVPGSTASYFLLDTMVDMDHLEGKNCYKVLQAVLTSFHLSITQGGFGWMLNKETSVVLSSGSVRYYSGGSAVSYPVFHFGSVSDHSGQFWPVGHITREYVPARKRIVLTSDNHYKPNILTGTWTRGGGATVVGTYHNLPVSGGIISQTYTYFDEIRQDLVLTIQARNVGNGTDAGSLGVYVIAKNSSLSYYLTNQSSAQTDPSRTVWSVGTDAFCVYELPAPSTADTDDDFTTVEIVVPLYNIGLVATALEVRIFNNDALYPKRVYDVSLFKREQFKGFEKTVNIDNGSRGEASDVKLSVTGLTGSNDYDGIEDLQTGMLRNANGLAKIPTLNTGIFSGYEYLSLMAREYALSYVSPRVRLSGVLNVPTDTLSLPGYFIDDFDSVLYIVETFSWDLYHDECTVQMISLPASGLTVESEAIEELAMTDTSQRSSSGGSSGGGGGGGGTGTVTSVAVTVPTGMTVSGSPITSSGTIALGLESGVTLHGHTNKGVLDTITAAQTQNWDTAYQQAHTHSNKTVLDGITSGKVSNWDAAYSAISGLTAQSSMSAPLVRIMKGFTSTPNQANPYAAQIRFEHPLLALGGEVVLMVRQKRNRKKVGTNQSESSNYHWPRKGWAVAKGYQGSLKWTYQPSSASFVAYQSLLDLQQYICRYYTQLGSYTRAQMESLSYVSWCNTVATSNFGFDDGDTFHHRKYSKKRRMFGIAVRIVNPDWIENASGSPVEHTQGIVVSGKLVPRYLYTDVTPMIAEISEDPGTYSQKLGLMPL